MMNLNEEREFNMKQMWTESPGNCFVALVGVKYFQVVDQIEKRLEKVQEELNAFKMEKMFFFEHLDKSVLPVTMNFKKPKAK